MAEYQIVPDPAGVTIEVKGVAGRQADLTGAFQECQTGHCTCPTDEYEKLDAMEIAAKDDEITLRLRSKQGTQFDQREIAACLDYTMEKVNPKGLLHAAPLPWRSPARFLGRNTRLPGQQ